MQAATKHKLQLDRILLVIHYHNSSIKDGVPPNEDVSLKSNSYKIKLIPGVS